MGAKYSYKVWEQFARHENPIPWTKQWNVFYRVPYVEVKDADDSEKDGNFDENSGTTPDNIEAFVFRWAYEVYSTV